MSTTKIYAAISNNGDGSSSLHWFTNELIINYLMDKDPETWGCNEIGSVCTLEIPDHMLNQFDITDWAELLEDSSPLELLMYMSNNKFQEAIYAAGYDISVTPTMFRDILAKLADEF